MWMEIVPACKHVMNYERKLEERDQFSHPYYKWSKYANIKFVFGAFCLGFPLV